MRRALYLVCSLMLAASSAAARSGNDLIVACHGVLEHQRPDAAEAFVQGVCMGTVATVMQLGPHGLKSICPPPNATNYQAVRIVVKFMDDTPERLDGEFVAIAIAALQKAWPCTQ